jgi:hypothetical protein
MRLSSRSGEGSKVGLGQKLGEAFHAAGSREAAFCYSNAAIDDPKDFALHSLGTDSKASPHWLFSA